MSTKKTFFAHNAILAVALVAVVCTLTSCRDEIAEEKRYTFIGNTVASFLEEDTATYSSFIYILKKGNRYNLMEAYGDYTCFAPTNEAVARYLYEQDSIYKNPPAGRDSIITGVYSTVLEELSAAKCKEIAQTHILPAEYKTNEINGVIPTMNLNDRYISYDVAEGAKKMVNGYAQITDPDNEVENGIVHGGLTRVLHLSTNTLPVQLEDHDFFSLFSQALKETGIDELLHDIEDIDYVNDGTEGPKYQNNAATTARPLKRLYGYSVFAETDAVFEAYKTSKFPNGIRTLHELKDACMDWYPEAKDSTDALYQFVAYHIINQNVMYEHLCYVDYGNAEDGGCWSDPKGGNDANESKATALSDRVEYYETWNNHILKVTVPRKDGFTITKRVVNFTSRARQGNVSHIVNNANIDMANHVDIQVYSPTEMQEMYGEDSFDPEARNGRIHPIGKILLYNETEMSTNILYDIMRFDFSALLPELRNSNMRWCKTGEAGSPIYSGKAAFCLVDNNMNYLEKSKHFKVNNKETMLFYLCPNINWQNFQGDEMMVTGKYDISYKLPPLPTGTYEIRVGYSANELRGIVQFYINDKVTGIPVDLRKLATDGIVGWKSDYASKQEGDTGTGIDGKTYAGIINDKDMKNRGYLKGPNTVKNGGITDENGDAGWNGLRNSSGTLRRVVAVEQLKSGEDNWFRMKNVMRNATSVTQGMHDYLEIVPLTYVNDESIPLDEKRK